MKIKKNSWLYKLWLASYANDNNSNPFSTTPFELQLEYIQEKTAPDKTNLCQFFSRIFFMYAPSLVMIALFLFFVGNYPLEYFAGLLSTSLVMVFILVCLGLLSLAIKTLRTSKKYILGEKENVPVKKEPSILGTYIRDLKNKTCTIVEFEEK